MSLILASVAGCTTPPATFTEGVEYVAHREQICDAHAWHVADHPELRVDDALEERLVYAASTTDRLDEARQTAMQFVDEAAALAIAVTRDEIDRLDGDGVAELRRLYFDDRPLTRAQIIAAFVAEADRGAADLRAGIAGAATPGELEALLAPLRESLETPVKERGRFARMAPWLLFTIPSWIAIENIYSSEEHDNCDVPFDGATVYMPSMASTLAVEHGHLLGRYAPIIVQERTPDDATYAASADRIGTVAATNPDWIEVRTDAATVYAYAREVRIGGRPHLQLTYAHWYPEHPELRPDDPEAGHIDGATLRITLDADERPLVFETVLNCGCYHRLYPSAALEAAAARQFGRPAPDKTFSIEREVPGRKDLIVPNTVRLPDSAEAIRPVIRVRSGWHGIVDVGFEVDKHGGERHATADYRLHDYAELEHLRAPDGLVTSMFYDNGLVRHAERLEGVYFTPAGILSAGQPRQRGTQLIHWDDWDFDDPNLFVRGLRLPGGS